MSIYLSILISRQTLLKTSQLMYFLIDARYNIRSLSICPGLWIISCEEVIQLAYGTSVVLVMCPLSI